MLTQSLRETSLDVFVFEWPVVTLQCLKYLSPFSKKTKQNFKSLQISPSTYSTKLMQSSTYTRFIT